MGWTVRDKHTHYFLGVFSSWIPLPYLAKAQNPKDLALGICFRGHCACLLDSEVSHPTEKYYKEFTSDRSTFNWYTLHIQGAFFVLFLFSQRNIVIVSHGPVVIF
jgi:hypothetical protein